MEQSQTFNPRDPFPLLFLLMRYYSGILLSWNAEGWRITASSLKEYVSLWEGEEPVPASITKGLELLQQVTDEETESLPFEFNRLFVGPGRLLASPYESSYRNPERSLMQKETLAVRSFYSQAGLQVAHEGRDPDDHLALELEFLCYLLAHGDQEHFPDLYNRFVKEHLLPWCPAHCELIHESTNHPICQAMAFLLEGFLEKETRQDRMSGLQRSERRIKTC